MKTQSQGNKMKKKILKLLYDMVVSDNAAVVKFDVNVCDCAIKALASVKIIFSSADRGL